MQPLAGLSPTELRAHILCEISRRVTELLTGPGASVATLARVEVPLPPISPLRWLAAQRDTTQYYWQCREGEFEMAGIGEADVVVPSMVQATADLFRWLRSRLPEHSPTLRYYGGFRFYRKVNPSGRWRHFKEFRFVVPRFEVIQRRSGCRFAVNVLVGSKKLNEQTLSLVLQALEAVTFPSQEGSLPLPAVVSRRDSPDFQGWKAWVEQALDAIAHHRFEKVVLSRETVFTAHDAWDAVALLERLRDASSPSYMFCFHPAPDRAFIGITPERLFRRINTFVQSEALAGTRPRGKTDREDAALAEILRSSDKELREHRFVVQMVRQNLRRLCHVIQEADAAPAVLRLKHCQHLYTRLEGLLHHPDADAELLDALHPTPAVGGLPREAALDWLAETEPFDRGIYGAPVGWVGFDTAEFCVAIRSALIQQNELAVYTGAGIVGGSTPTEEWDEIETKLAPYKEAVRSE